MSLVPPSTGDDRGPVCRECKQLLTEENWSAAHRKYNNKLCRTCQSRYNKNRYIPKEMTEEEKLERLVGKLRNEERIQRMTHWIKEFNLKATKLVRLEELRQIALRQNTDPADAERQVEDESRTWTYETLAKKQWDTDVIANVLKDHHIISSEDGDTFSTWHIAFSECDYTEYVLDDDGLPIAREGIPRGMYFNMRRRKADREFFKGERFGIVSDRFFLTPKKSENRIFLCKKEETFNKLFERMQKRHHGDNVSMQKLDASMKRDAESVQRILDGYIQLHNREA